MVYGFSVWKCDSMRWNSSEASYWLPTLTPPSHTTKRAPLALCWSLFPLVSSLHIYTPSTSTLTNPFLTLLDVCVYFSFTFTPGVVSPMHMRCGRLPGRYRRCCRVSVRPADVTAIFIRLLQAIIS